MKLVQLFNYKFIQRERNKNLTLKVFLTAGISEYKRRVVLVLSYILLDHAVVNPPPPLTRDSHRK